MAKKGTKNQENGGKKLSVIGKLILVSFIILSVHFIGVEYAKYSQESILSQQAAHTFEKIHESQIRQQDSIILDAQIFQEVEEESFQQSSEEIAQQAEDSTKQEAETVEQVNENSQQAIEASQQQLESSLQDTEASQLATESLEQETEQAPETPQQEQISSQQETEVSQQVEAPTQQEAVTLQQENQTSQQAAEISQQASETLQQEENSTQQETEVSQQVESLTQQQTEVPVNDSTQEPEVSQQQIESTQSDTENQQQSSETPQQEEEAQIQQEKETSEQLIENSEQQVEQIEQESETTVQPENSTQQEVDSQQEPTESVQQASETHQQAENLIQQEIESSQEVIESLQQQEVESVASETLQEEVLSPHQEEESIRQETETQSSQQQSESTQQVESQEQTQTISNSQTIEQPEKSDLTLNLSSELDLEELYQIPSLQQTIDVNEKLLEDARTKLVEKYSIESREKESQILEQLNVLFNSLEQATLNPSIIKSQSDPKNGDLKNNFMGYYRDEEYCAKNDLYLFTHPQEVYNNITLYSDIGDEYTRDNIFNDFSTVASEVFGYEIPNEYMKLESFAAEVNITQFYLNRFQYTSAFKVGKQIGCIFQGINKIPNSGAFTRKEGLAKNYLLFSKKVGLVKSTEEDNSQTQYSEQCLKEFKYIPDTYNLNISSQCSEFFTEVLSDEFKQKTQSQGFQFIAKLGSNVHQGKGIQVLTEEVILILAEKYDGGKKCGEIKDKNSQLIQRYLNNPLLLNGVKFEVRMHFVIASVNPLVIYAQDKGGVAFCALKYSAFDSQIQRHICVYNIARELLKLSDEQLFTLSGKTREEFMSSFSYQHTLESLQVALESEGTVPSNWVNEHFIPSVFRNYIHTVQMVRGHLLNNTRFYEMYAPDILVDKSTMQPFVLEYNTNPRFVNTSSFVHDWNLSTVKDIVLLKMAEIRSKYYRISKIVDEYITQLQNSSTLPDQQEYLNRLVEASSTKIEPQFNVDHLLSSYLKIYDEHNPEQQLYYKGTKIWNQECSH